MEQNFTPEPRGTRYRYILAGFLHYICWIIAIGGFFMWEIHGQHEMINGLAAAEGRASFNKDLVCTGFSENLTPERASGIGIAKILMKPIRKKN